MAALEASYDTVVVGAGWFGLAAAKARLESHPTEKLVVLEAAESVGGTWSENRLYPGLKSNNMVGTYEYPDFPMSADVYGVRQAHIPGAVLHRYLTDFSRKFGIYSRIHFHTTLSVVEPSSSGGWILTVTQSKGQTTFETKRLILATGLTSTPNLPKYAGAQSFDAPFFHSKDFCQEAPNLKNIKNAVVVGGAKSAYDVAYALVNDGATVDLVVRPTGRGPVWIAPIYVTPFKKRIDQLLLLRWMTWFSPCTWGPEDGFLGVRRFLHGTRIGRFLVDGFWKVLGNDVLTRNNYDNDPELTKLKPWYSAFWIGSGLSILNYDTSFFDMIRQKKVRVHLANIDHLEPHKVVLESGQEIEADALICSTGWKKESSLEFRGLPKHGIGLPFTDEEKAALNKKADQEVLALFPRLANQPDLELAPAKHDPLRLYRFMIPFSFLQQRNLAFAGMVSTVSTAICASIQGLWISQFFDGKVGRIPQTDEEIVHDIMLHSQGMKWRFGACGYGNDLPDFVFESVPYFDFLLKDLGLNNYRKSGLLEEVTTPYKPGDYAGLLEELEEKESLKKD
ncbi:hypothetical protein DV738_g4372, partial [Chaetothyriales sp. CBS 135597]